ncbi:IclR family transcriptional regulator [Pararhizobium antarcticum]|uniref:IclR family transcriptional regulator n=1 Tax=Pararhizobium antarcticum TaxID=1798805 RepID=A0A657LYI8_9HYPH|nr:IclR family transcriptional regulator [Pararhizobium antarcticum]OJG00535.1 IclR family transcriptional regulator [Pararhizobium antarcticum]
MAKREFDRDDDVGRVAANDTGTLGKAIAVLELVSTAQTPLRFTEILALSGQPRGTLHRHLSHLVEEGLLNLAPDLRYEPGMRLLKFASNAWAKNQFRTVAEPHLKTLHERTGETVHLGILHGQEIIYLDKVESRQAVRMNSQIGNASPVYCTGVGKAALSVLPQKRLDDLMAQFSFHSYTPTTHRSASELMAELLMVRRVGYAFDREEHESGIRCVAAPIDAPRHGIVAGVSVTGPAYRVAMEQLEIWAVVVKEAAHAIERDVEVRLGPGR